MALRQAIVAQFRKPDGLAGALAGHIMALRTSNRQRSLWTVELLDLHSASEVLEFGCGPGLALVECARRTPEGRVTGLDHSPVMVAQAENRSRKANLERSPIIKCSRIEEMPKFGCSFDAVFSVNVIQFLPDMTGTFSIIRGLLKPSGTVATTFQPRSANASRTDTFAMAEKIEAAMTCVGFSSIHRHELPLKPVPAVCVTGMV